MITLWTETFCVNFTVSYMVQTIAPVRRVWKLWTERMHGVPLDQTIKSPAETCFGLGNVVKVLHINQSLSLILIFEKGQ